MTVEAAMAVIDEKKMSAGSFLYCSGNVYILIFENPTHRYAFSYQLSAFRKQS